jgi:hypothetical protein
MASAGLSWNEFAKAAPRIAAEGQHLLNRDGDAHAFLVTVRGAESPPRIHPISVGIVDGHLYAFLLASAKRTDLETDGRYALHAMLDPVVPAEFSIRGRARVVDAPATRAAVAAAWTFEPDDTYMLFEFGIQTAVVGERASADEWPPRYTTWKAG